MKRAIPPNHKDLTVRNPSRRTVLKGVGATIALPWLETFAAPVGKKVATAPRRLGVVFMGNGVNPEHWWAKNGDKGLELSKSLQPLTPIKNKLLAFEGLWNPTSVAGPGGHYPKMNVLSGLKVKQTTTDVEIGTTMDQVVAQQVGRNSQIPSLVLGTESPRYATDVGYTALYSAYVSWTSPTTPAPKEIYPQLAFDRLFGSNKHRAHDKSILDAVMTDAGSLKNQLSNRDRNKLDEYLTSVRELEQRIDRSAKIEAAADGWKPTLVKPNMPRPGREIPTHVDEHLRLMFDLMVLAFQTNKTRVATYMMTNDLSNMNFSHLGGIRGGQHEISHHAGNPKQLEMYHRINQHCVKLWSESLQKMHAINEGERSLLDNSMILFLSSLWDGNAHDSKQLPVLLAGGGGGTIKGGRHLDFTGREDRKLCRLHLALMDRMGIRLDQFGDADTPMSELG
jgi:hypothetical protein